jgi:transcriptional regulator
MANLPVSVGHELLNVPFPEMVEKLALAIAKAQMSLDLSSIQTAQALANTTIPEGTVVVAIKETVDEDGNVTNTEVLYNEKEMPLLVYGLNPTFYNFADTIIEVKMAITMVIERATSVSFGSKFSFENKTKFTTSFKSGGLASLLVGKGSASLENTTTVAYSATMDAKYSSKFSFKEEGSSLLRTVLRPVPPPQRAIPKITVVEPAAPGP